MKRPSPTPIYLIFNSSRELFFSIIFTVNLVYQVTVVGLNPLQLVLVGTLLETVIFLFEIPTGVVADIYSRKLSVIIGAFLMGVGFILEGSFPYFAAVMVCQVLWGIGYTFTSGATDAWIADEVGDEHAGAVFLQGTQAGVLGGLIGAIISVGLGSIRINIPIVTGGGLFLLLGIFLAIFMPEHGFSPKTRVLAAAPTTWIKENWASALSTFRNGFFLARTHRGLTQILVIGLFFGLYSEGFDRLWTPHLIKDITLPTLGDLSTVFWFGLISIVAQVLTLAATEFARRKLSPDNPWISFWTLAVTSLGQVFGLVVFAVTRNFALALAAYWEITLARNLKGPYYTAWVNRHLTSDVRATVLSMSSQVDALGQIVGGPILGVIGNSISITAALIGSAVMLSPVLAFFANIFRVEKRTRIPSEKQDSLQE